MDAYRPRHKNDKPIGNKMPLSPNLISLNSFMFSAIGCRYETCSDLVMKSLLKIMKTTNRTKTKMVASLGFPKNDVPVIPKTHPIMEIPQTINRTLENVDNVMGDTSTVSRRG